MTKEDNQKYQEHCLHRRWSRSGWFGRTLQVGPREIRADPVAGEKRAFSPDKSFKRKAKTFSVDEAQARVARQKKDERSLNSPGDERSEMLSIWSNSVTPTHISLPFALIILVLI
jgi:hypothetical protein